MPKTHGKNAVLFVKEYKLSGDANRLSFNYAIDTAEVSGFEAQGKEHVGGLYQWTVGMDGFWNSADGRADPIISQMVGLGTHVVGIYPQGTTPEFIGYDGAGILTNYAPEDAIGGAVVFSADIQGDSKLYRQTIIHSGITIGTTPYTDTGNWRNLGTLNPSGLISASVRAISPSAGTASGLQLHASTSPVGISAGVILAFDTQTNTGVQFKTTGTAVNVGPYWGVTYTIPSQNSFNFIISCGINQ